MATEQRMHQCKRCSKATLHVSSTTSHVLHFLLSIPTLGVWMIVWFLMGLFHSAQSECTQCGKNRLALLPMLALIAFIALIMAPFVAPIVWDRLNADKNLASVGKEVEAKQRASEPGIISARFKLSDSPEPRPARNPDGMLRGDAQLVARTKRERAAQRAMSGAIALKKMMRDPESFKLESALVIESTGGVCYEYRSHNGFGGVNAEQAVLSADLKNFKTSEDHGFGTLWDKECANRRGTETAAGLRWLLKAW